MTHNHAINIPEDLWENTGSDEDATSRLLCQIVVNGTMLHLEAYAVAWERQGACVLPEAAMRTENDCTTHEHEPSERVERKSPDEARDGVQMAADSEWDDTFAYVQQGIYGDGPWYTTWIRGREYVLFATPGRD